jgi:Uma2 family endonuclease
MATATTTPAAPATLPYRTLADVLKHLGGVPPARVRVQPPPGTATVADVTAVHDRENRLCELVDGILVEKVMGFEESRIAVRLILILGNYVDGHDLGTVVGADGMMQLSPGLVRIPDVAFISWDRLPKSRRGRQGAPLLAPDLAVEVLSKGNTKKEMARKLREYFEAGVRLVWYADPESRTVRAFTSPTDSVLLGEGDTLDGGDVLPGFRLRVRDWFAEAERTGPKPRRAPKRRD